MSMLHFLFEFLKVRKKDKSYLKVNIVKNTLVIEKMMHYVSF